MARCRFRGVGERLPAAPRRAGGVRLPNRGDPRRRRSSRLHRPRAPPRSTTPGSAAAVRPRRLSRAWRKARHRRCAGGTAARPCRRGDALRPRAMVFGVSLRNTAMTMLDDGENEIAGAPSTIIQSVVVAASVLEALAAAGKPVRLTELAEQLGEAKARIHRHLTTLRSVGLVDQDRSSERYRLGWKLVNLGQAAADQFEIRAVAEPFLLRLRDLAHQTVVLSVPVNGEAMVTMVMESANLVTISVRQGARLPAHASAQGRIALA